MEADSQLLCLLIDQQDGENFIIDDLAHQFSHTSQGGVQVEGGVDYICYFEQQRLHFQLEIGLSDGGFHYSL